jgi:hypothetical protein
MLQRTLPAGFIAPCLPTKTNKLPSGDLWLYAGIEDYELALATYQAACERWPGPPITLRQGARVIEDSRRLRVV